MRQYSTEYKKKVGKALHTLKERSWLQPTGEEAPVVKFLADIHLVEFVGVESPPVAIMPVSELANYQQVRVFNHYELSGLGEEFVQRYSEEQLLSGSFLLPDETPDTPLPNRDSMTIPTEISDSLKHFQKDHPDSAKVAFVMMRFGTTPAHTSIVDSIRSTLQPLGVTAVRADDKEYHSDLWPNILTYIYGCGFGIAVFERLDADEFNPNVSLEVGHLYGLGKPVCLLKDKTLKTLHTDLVGKLYRPFDPHNPAKTIPTELSKWIKDKGIAK